MKTTSSEKILIHYDKVAAARKIELTHAYAGQLNHVVAEFGKLNEKAKINSIEELKTFLRIPIWYKSASAGQRCYKGPFH